jgi:hypothetical protein
MRRLAPAVLFAALLAAGCSNECQDLGDRICKCSGVGTTRDNCQRQIQDELKRLNPSSAVQHLCGEKLSTCNAPSGADFCDWLVTSCGKASCGFSTDAPADVCLPPAP